MKYKLLKRYPSLPKDWEVGMILGQGDLRPNDYAPCNAAYFGMFIIREHVENNPEFFAPYLFTTKDGVDIYKGDTYWRVCNEGSYPYIVRDANVNGNKIYFATFSTKEEALKTYISPYKKGEWLYSDKFNKESICKFSHIVGDEVWVTEDYYFGNGMQHDISNNAYLYCKVTDVRLATPEETIRLLGKALHNLLKHTDK